MFPKSLKNKTSRIKTWECPTKNKTNSTAQTNSTNSTKTVDAIIATNRTHLIRLHFSNETTTFHLTDLHLKSPSRRGRYAGATWDVWRCMSFWITSREIMMEKALHRVDACFQHLIGGDMSLGSFCHGFKMHSQRFNHLGLCFFYIREVSKILCQALVSHHLKKCQSPRTQSFGRRLIKHSWSLYIYIYYIYYTVIYIVNHTFHK